MLKLAARRFVRSGGCSLVQRALISVYDKTGIVDFAQRLAALGIEIVSTGRNGETVARRGHGGARRGGADRLAGNAGRAREDAASESAWRNFVSARRRRKIASKRRSMASSPIDLVVVNLYPF